MKILQSQELKAILSLELMRNFNFYVGGLSTQSHSPQSEGPASMTLLANIETAGLTTSDEWITVVSHDTCCHTNVPEREVPVDQERNG
jgi:hypothetical protein